MSEWPVIDRRRAHECVDAGQCLHAEEAAEKAVKKVFAILGVDIEKPESVEEFREDLRFGKKLRKGADHGFLIMMGIIATAIMAALWAGITEKVGK